jgi:hypothetical protein
MALICSLLPPPDAGGLGGCLFAYVSIQLCVGKEIVPDHPQDPAGIECPGTS